jgi:hypothetical protein
MTGTSTSLPVIHSFRRYRLQGLSFAGDQVEVLPSLWCSRAYHNSYSGRFGMLDAARGRRASGVVVHSLCPTVYQAFTWMGLESSFMLLYQYAITFHYLKASY